MGEKGFIHCMWFFQYTVFLPDYSFDTNIKAFMLLLETRAFYTDCDSHSEPQYANNFKDIQENAGSPN